MEVLASVADTVQGIQTKFGLNWPLFIAQAINFTVVAWIIWKFAFKGILSKMEDREKEISDSLKNAEKIKFQLEETERKQEETLKDASVEAQKALSQAREQAQSYLVDQRSAAELQAKEIVTKAREAMEQERRRVMDEAKTEIASLVVMTSSKVLGRELNEEERTRFSDAASREADFSLN